jgi:hypothetical protein
MPSKIGISAEMPIFDIGTFVRENTGWLFATPSHLHSAHGILGPTNAKANVQTKTS